MSETNNRPEALSMFQKSDLFGGIFGADSPRNETQSIPFAEALMFGTFAELGTYGMIAPSVSTTELLGVVMVTNSSTEAQKALFKQSADSLGGIGKGGYIVCQMDVDNKPSVGDAVNVTLEAEKVGYVTSKTSGGVLTVDKAIAKVIKVFDTHCLVEINGDNVIACTYAA